MRWTIHSRAAVVAVVLLAGLAGAIMAEDNPYIMHAPPAFVGRWDLTVHSPDGDHPSWLEITQSGYRTIVGQYVGQVGSTRPISNITWEDSRFEFSVPPQWERRTSDVTFDGALDGQTLRGELIDENGRRVKWEGRRAPALVRKTPPQWGQAIELFNGKDLAGWKPRVGDKHGWIVKNGVLINAEPGVDIVSDQKFEDFKLHVEFRLPKGSNSGLYLRGRYEVQTTDDFGKDPDAHRIGAIYGFLPPRIIACKQFDEWQTFDIELVGREVTITLNGETVISRQAIPGITGGALDSHEGAPGPLMLQGDHGVVEFRKVTITPARG